MLRAYVFLHIAIFLFGYTAILGRLITLDFVELVWYRMLLVTLTLPLFPPLFRAFKKVDRTAWYRILPIGMLVTLHWFCFYASVKFANASVALAMLATTAVFTSIAEPLIVRRPFRRSELLLAFFAVPPMFMVFHVAPNYTVGIIFGLLAALIAAVFSSYNKRLLNTYAPEVLLNVQMIGGLILSSVALGGWALLALFTDLPQPEVIPSPGDWVRLVILALVCTTLAYLMALYAMQKISAFTAALSLNLEPFYGILLAIPILRENEELRPEFYLATLILIAVIVIHSVFERRRRRRLRSQTAISEPGT